jgi:radical SAM/Cys-rich protein
VNTERQREILSHIDGIEDFNVCTSKIKPEGITASKIEIFQINIGRKCNLFCKHCHVQAGPDRKEMMSIENIEKCENLIKKYRFPTIDITGGAPELFPQLESFLDNIVDYTKRIIVRSNLTLLTEEKYNDLIKCFIRNKVEIVSSLPDLKEIRTNKQRGDCVFQKCVKSLQMLNKLGYAQENTGLKLDLVHNPVGAYMPGPQPVMEKQYKQELRERYGIEFNSLYCITNMPISRFLEFLLERDLLEDYMETLTFAFNPATLDNLMCRNTISVSWDGKLYDCDFNQMLDMPVGCNSDNLDNFDLNDLENRKIVVLNHCYGCTAGSGSSCQGATND